MLLKRGLLGLAQVEIGERRQAPIEQVADQRLLDLAEPADELRRQPPRNAVGQQEVEVLLLRAGEDFGLQRHDRREAWRIGRRSVTLRGQRWIDGRRTALAFFGLGAAALATVGPDAAGAAWSCRARSTARSPGHARMSRRLARLVPFYAYDEEPVLLLRRRARRRRRATPRRLHAARRAVRDAIPRDHAGRPPRSTDAHLRSAVHRYLPGAVPVQPRRAAAPAGRRLPAVVLRRHGDRSRRQRVLRSDRLVRRQPVRLRLLQGVHGARARRVRELGPVLGAYHPVVAYNVQRLRANLRASTRCRSTCRAPRR